LEEINRLHSQNHYTTRLSISLVFLYVRLKLKFQNAVIILEKQYQDFLHFMRKKQLMGMI